MELSPKRGQAIGPTKRLVQLLCRYLLVCYFLLALGFTWAYELAAYGALVQDKVKVGYERTIAASLPDVPLAPPVALKSGTRTLRLVAAGIGRPPGHHR